MIGAAGQPLGHNEHDVASHWRRVESNAREAMQVQADSWVHALLPAEEACTALHKLYITRARCGNCLSGPVRAEHLEHGAHVGLTSWLPLDDCMRPLKLETSRHLILSERAVRSHVMDTPL